jgi:hypothetical protein
MFDIREAIVVLLYDEDIYKHCEQHCYCPTDKELQGQQEAKKKAEMTRGRVIRTSLPGNGKYQGGAIEETRELGGERKLLERSGSRTEDQRVLPSTQIGT